MGLSKRAGELHEQVARETTKLGDLRRLAKETGTDHALALELWNTGDTNARLLAVLVMDKKQVDQALIDRLTDDLEEEPAEARTKVMDWLLANQLAKTKQGKDLMASWEHSPSALQRRTFWYQQARLRWTGQTPPPNSEVLLDALEARMATEVPEVQWAMNFLAGQVGTFEPEHRDRCIALGESTSLFRDEVVSRGCTPNYLPEFIRIQVEKHRT